MKLKQLPYPELIIFDWDDTLVDNYAAIHLAINAARAAFGQPVWTLAETRQNCRIALKEIFPIWFGADWPKAQEVFYATFAAEHIRHLRPKPFAAPLLAKLAKHRIPLAVNSNKQSGFLRAEIKHLGWEDFFSVVVGAGDVDKGKPAPDGINKIRQITRVESRQVWFVGDNQVDYETALAGSCVAIILGKQADHSASDIILARSLRALHDSVCLRFLPSDALK